MLKEFCGGLLFVLFSFGVKSQQTIEYGLQAGLNLSSASINGNSQQKGLLPGFNVGVQLKINKTKYFGLRTMLQYKQRGFMYKNELVEYPGNTIGRANILVRLNYIDLKILPVLTVGSGRQFYFYAGPALGILVGNKLITKLKDSVPPGSARTIHVKGDKRNPINFGVALGVGTQVPIGERIKIGFDVRSDIGLTNVLKNGKGKLRSLSFSSGLLFTFGPTRLFVPGCKIFVPG